MTYVLVMYFMFTRPDLGTPVALLPNIESCLKAGDAIMHASQQTIPEKGKEVHYGCYVK